MRKGAPLEGRAPESRRSSVSELPGRPSLAVVRGGDRFGQITGVAFDDGGFGDRRFVD
jgi:hypothetical protein